MTKANRLKEFSRHDFTNAKFYGNEKQRNHISLFTKKFHNIDLSLPKLQQNMKLKRREKKRKERRKHLS